MVSAATGDGIRAEPAAARRRADLAFGLLATIQATLILTVGVIPVPLPAIGRDLGLTTGQRLHVHQELVDAIVTNDVPAARRQPSVIRS